MLPEVRMARVVSPHVVKQDGSQTPAKRAPHSAVASVQLAVVIDGSLGQAGL